MTRFAIACQDCRQAGKPDPTYADEETAEAHARRMVLSGLHKFVTVYAAPEPREGSA